MPIGRRGPGLIRTAAVVGTATAVSGRVARRQQQRFAQEDAYAQASMPPEQSWEQPPQDDTTAQLQQLATLNQQGILTDEEFAAKKRQILGI